MTCRGDGSSCGAAELGLAETTSVVRAAPGVVLRTVLPCPPSLSLGPLVPSPRHAYGSREAAEKNDHLATPIDQQL